MQDKRYKTTVLYYICRVFDCKVLKVVLKEVKTIVFHQPNLNLKVLKDPLHIKAFVIYLAHKILQLVKAHPLHHNQLQNPVLLKQLEVQLLL